jgi:hypothetical protein
VASLKLALYKSITCVIWCRTRVARNTGDDGNFILHCLIPLG